MQLLDDAQLQTRGAASPLASSFSSPSNSHTRRPKEYQAESCCRRYFPTAVTFIAPMNNILHGYRLSRSHCIVFYTSASCQEEARVNSPWAARCNPDPRADHRCVFSTQSTGEDVRQVIDESRLAFTLFFPFFLGTRTRLASVASCLSILTGNASRQRGIRSRTTGSRSICLLFFRRDKPYRLGAFATISSFD